MRERASATRRRLARRLGAPCGFTLVELLVAVTISSLLVVAVVSATRALSSARRGVDQRVSRAMSARRAIGVIAGALRNVRRDPIRDEPVIVGLSGGGKARGDRIDLQVIGGRRVRPEGAESDQYEMSFFLARPRGHDLPVLMSRSDHGLDEHPGDGGIATVVAEGIVGLSFEYLADGQWAGEWPASRPRAPEAVRVIVAAVGPARDDSPAAMRPFVLSTVVPIEVNKPTERQPQPQPGQQAAPPGGPQR